MALPVLYWMLRCTGCGCRFVVHDTYLRCLPVTAENDSEGGNFDGPPVSMRYTCVRGCATAPEVVASTRDAGSEVMTMRLPHIRVVMTPALREEWRYLIEDPQRSVDTPFPRIAIVEDHEYRHPVVLMTDHDGTRYRLPKSLQAARWFEVMEPGQWLLFTRRDGGTLEVRRNDDVYDAQLLDGAGEMLEVKGLARAIVMAAIRRYIERPDVADTRLTLAAR